MCKATAPFGTFPAYIDVQFEPSSTPDTATAYLLHFSTGGTPVGAPAYDFGTDIGATSGSIAGGLVTMQNQYGSDYFQEFTPLRVCCCKGRSRFRYTEDGRENG